jgi:hypothetical protein
MQKLLENSALNAALSVLSAPKAFTPPVPILKISKKSYLIIKNKVTPTLSVKLLPML